LKWEIKRLTVTVKTKKKRKAPSKHVSVGHSLERKCSFEEKSRSARSGRTSGREVTKSENSKWGSCQ